MKVAGESSFWDFSGGRNKTEMSRRVNWGSASGDQKGRQFYRNVLLQGDQVGSQVEEGRGFGAERCVPSRQGREHV